MISKANDNQFAINKNQSVVKKGRVLVAMSGGVDSSVAAALLVEEGYEVIGATMQVWDYSQCEVEEGLGTCCSSLDVDDARAVADKLGIPFYVINCEAKFKVSVIDPFLENYLQGKTPSPCVNCNTYLKFDHLIQKMKELDCEYLATGHYAQVLKNEKGETCLSTSVDEIKDQTYFLFTLQKEIIPFLLFPVGSMTKGKVRDYAEKKGLITARKKDSTGICFVGHQSYAAFVEQHVPADVLQQKKGWILRYPSGEKMAQHEGIHYFTYGQSKGLGMDFHEKLFVIKVDSQDNSVWVGEEKHLYSSKVYLNRCHFISPPEEGYIFKVKIRYAHKGALARLRILPSSAADLAASRASATESATFTDSAEVELEFLEPQRALTPGQAAVFYNGSLLLGGGWIV